MKTKFVATAFGGRAAAIFFVAAGMLPAAVAGEPVPPPPPVKPGDLKTEPPQAEASTGQRVHKLSLDECIEIAVMGNLGLKSSRIADRVSDENVRIAWSIYFPTFNGSILHSNSRSSGRGPNDGLTQVQGGVTQLLPWGTQLDFSLSETRNKSDPSTAFGEGRMNLRQPIWRGMGTDVGLANIRQTRIQRLVARASLELQVQLLIFNIRSGYAEIIRQIQNREVNQQAVRSAKRFLELTDARWRAGQVTQLDVSNAEVQLRTREDFLNRTEALLEDAKDSLKQLMDVDLSEQIDVDAPLVDFGLRRDESRVPANPVAQPPNQPLDPATRERMIAQSITENKRQLRSDYDKGTVVVVTVEDGKAVDQKILFEAKRFDSNLVLNEALDNRLEIVNSRRQLAIQKLQALLAKDGLNYQVDMIAGFGRANNNRGLLEGDNGRELQDWNIGVQFTIPWGKISDKAAFELALLQLQNFEIELKRVRTQVELEARSTLRQLYTNEKSILINGQRVEQAKRSVDAAKISFERGLKDSFDVIRAEDDLLQAQVSFISSTLDYRVNLAQLDRTVGKATGRVDLSGQTPGGYVQSKISDELEKRGLPRIAPDAEPRQEDDPLNRSREYRKDPKPEPMERLQVVPFDN